MKESKNNILGAIIFIGLIMHFWVGYFHWDLVPGNTDILYSVTGYLLIDVAGLVVFVLCDQLKAGFLKLAGMAMMGLATYYIYMEFNDPYNWQVMDYKMLTTLSITFINLFFIFYFTDLIRKT